MSQVCLIACMIENLISKTVPTISFKSCSLLVSGLKISSRQVSFQRKPK